MTNRTSSKPTSMMLDPHEAVPLRAEKEVPHVPL